MSRALELAALTGVVIAIWVLYLYRKRRLKEDHAVLWIFVSVSIVILSTWGDILLAINRVVGAENPADLVQAAFTAFLLLVCIYYSVRISELTEQNKKLAQEITVQRAELKRNPEKETQHA